MPQSSATAQTYLGKADQTPMARERNFSLIDPVLWNYTFRLFMLLLYQVDSFNNVLYLISRSLILPYK